MPIPSRRVLLLAGVATVLGAAAAACGSGYDAAHNHNTGVGGYIAPANQIIEFPNTFNNVARSCVDHDGVYVTHNDGHSSSMFVVPNDPACP